MIVAAASPRVECPVRCVLGLGQQSAGCDETCADGEKDNDQDHHSAIVLACGAGMKDVTLACEHDAERKDQVDRCAQVPATAPRMLAGQPLGSKASAATPAS